MEAASHRRQRRKEPRATVPALGCLPPAPAGGGGGQFSFPVQLGDTFSEGDVPASDGVEGEGLTLVT